MGGASGSIKKSCAHRLIFTNSGGHLSSSVRVIPTSSFVFFFVLPMLCCKLSYSNIACADSAESLQLTMTEVLKRQCSKSKKGYKQVRVILNVMTCSLSLWNNSPSLPHTSSPSGSTSQSQKWRWTRCRWMGEIPGRRLLCVWIRMKRSLFKVSPGIKRSITSDFGGRKNSSCILKPWKINILWCVTYMKGSKQRVKITLLQAKDVDRCWAADLSYL